MRAGIFCIATMMVFFARANDTIVVRQDPRMDVLTAAQKQFNQRVALMLPNGLYRGFRIQVISTSKRDDAFKLKADLETQFPDQKTYIVFQSPNFKVRIGNFIKREEADKFKALLNKVFPNGVYIVDDGVEYIQKEEDDTTIP